MKTQEKKFFAPILKTYENDLSKRWRVEWNVPIHNGQLSKRIVDYGNINRGNTVEERLALAQLLITNLNFNSGDPVREETKAPGAISVDTNILEQTLKLHRSNWRIATVRVYQTVSTSFINFLGMTSPSDVTDEIVNSYIISLVDTESSPKKLRKYISRLRTLYNLAKEYKLIDHNPITVKSPKKQSVESLCFFNDSQIQLFKNAEIQRELWLAIQLLFYCFIRPEEARQLKIQHINLDYDFIEIPGSISKNNKTQKVSIPVQLKQLLLKYMNYPSHFYLIGYNGIPGEKLFPQKRLYVLHTRLLSKLGIVGRYSLYSWKHTGVVKVVKAGINIKDLQMQLRHHSLDMVNEYLKNLGVLDSEDLKYNFPTL